MKMESAWVRYKKYRVKSIRDIQEEDELLINDLRRDQVYEKVQYILSVFGGKSGDGSTADGEEKTYEQIW